MYSALHFAEFFGEGFLGFAILLVIPAVIVFLDREKQPERKSAISMHLENHFFDRVAALASRASHRNS